MRRVLTLGLDVYGYVTLTSPESDALADHMARFVDRLQQMDVNLPLRLIPLEIRQFNPVTSRMDDQRRASLNVQQDAIAAWNFELESRFDAELRTSAITTVPLHSRLQ
jgi:hypothetical protein